MPPSKHSSCRRRRLPCRLHHPWAGLHGPQPQARHAGRGQGDLAVGGSTAGRQQRRRVLRLLCLLRLLLCLLLRLCCARRRRLQLPLSQPDAHGRQRAAAAPRRARRFCAARLHPAQGCHRLSAGQVQVWLRGTALAAVVCAASRMQ